MTKLMTIEISGIKCDNPDCDYRDMTVRRENYLEYLGKPCPECDSVLLTQADYEAVLALESLEEELEIDIPAELLGELKAFGAEMDGSGKISLFRTGDKDEEDISEIPSTL